MKCESFCLVFYLICFFLAGCNGKNEVERDFYSDGTIKEERYYRNKKDREAGNYCVRKYNEDGLLVKSGQYKNFKKEGFFCIGNIQFGSLQIYEYKNDRPNGIGKKYKSGFLTIEVLFKDSLFILERSLAKFIDSTLTSTPDSWGYIVYNYGADSLIEDSQGKIEFKEDIRDVISTGNYSIDTTLTDYYLDNLQDTINLKFFKAFEVDLSAIKMPAGYDYLYSELILGDLNSAYKLSDTTNIFSSEPKIKQIKSDSKSVFKKAGHQSITGILNIYALDLQKDTVKEVKTYFKQVYVGE